MRRDMAVSEAMGTVIVRIKYRFEKKTISTMASPRPPASSDAEETARETSFMLVI